LKPPNPPSRYATDALYDSVNDMTYLVNAVSRSDLSVPPIERLYDTIEEFNVD